MAQKFIAANEIFMRNARSIGKDNEQLDICVMRPIVAIFFLVATTLCFAQTKNGFDLSNSSIEPAKIKRGGPGRDEIPSIDSPRFLTAEDASFLKNRDRIIGVSYRGIDKAYPLRILNWHEIVNDNFEDERVLVTYCPLCGTGMVFNVTHAEIDFTFGVSGLLYNSDVLLYDRQTESLWSQIMGEAISGPLKGVGLSSIASRHTTWRQWRQLHPGTLVLSTKTGHRRNYGSSPYLDYARSGRLMFGVEHTNDEYRRKELVLGISLGDKHRAYPFQELEQHGLPRFDDEFAGSMFTIVWSESEASAHVLDRTGNEIPSLLAYWFAWYAFHPDTEIFRAEN